jgi:carotenoid cleavage dioxygenase
VARPSFALELPALPETSNPALTGWRTPVRTESTSTGPFHLDGPLPPGLEGRLVFLGPNPVVVRDPASYDPADGDGMAHALEIRDGALVEQRSRLVVTRQLVGLLGARAPEGPLAAAGPVGSRALVKVASRLVALDGEGLGYRLSVELRTICVEDFDATLTSPMGTQVVLDPASGEAHFVGVDPLGPPWLRLHRLRASGELAGSVEIELAAWPAEPSVGLTHAAVLLAESSLAAAPLRGPDDELGPLRFDPDYAPRVGVVDLADEAAGPRWSVSEPGHVAAIAATREEPLGPAAFALRSSPERAGDPDWWPPGGAGQLELLELNEIGRSVAITRLDDLLLCAIDGDASCHQADRRFLYGLSAERAGSAGAMVVMYDLTTGAATRWPLADELCADPPLFVRDPDGHSDEEGWLVVPCQDRAEGCSKLLVFDASSFGGPPVSTATLPRRLPSGLRGLFLAPSDYR